MQTTTDLLRPYTVLELLDRAFRIYRENFVAFIGLVALITISHHDYQLSDEQLACHAAFRTITPSGTLSRASSAQALSALSGMISAYAVLIVDEIAIGIIYGVLVNGPLVYMTSENHLGRRVTLAEAWRTVQGSLPRLAVALTLFY